MQSGDSMIRRLSELRAAQPADTTLRNLIEILLTKLDISARLPVLVFEAEEDGAHDCARLFRSLAMSEKQEIALLLDGLRTHLETRQDELPAASPAGGPRPQA